MIPTKIVVAEQNWFVVPALERVVILAVMRKKCCVIFIPWHTYCYTRRIKTALTQLVIRKVQVVNQTEKSQNHQILVKQHETQLDFFFFPSMLPESPPDSSSEACSPAQIPGVVHVRVVSLSVCWTDNLYWRCETETAQTSTRSSHIGPGSRPPRRSSTPQCTLLLPHPVALRIETPPTTWPTISSAVWASLTLTSSLGLRPSHHLLRLCTSIHTTHLSTCTTWAQTAARRFTPRPLLLLRPHLPQVATLHSALVQMWVHI